LLDKYFSKREPSPPLPTDSPSLKKAKISILAVKEESSNGEDDEEMVDETLQARQLQSRSLRSPSDEEAEEDKGEVLIDTEAEGGKGEVIIDEELEEGNGQVPIETAPPTILPKRVVVPIPILQEILEIGPNEYP
jgi:hypothetical protein